MAAKQQQERTDIVGETLGDWGKWQFRTVLLIFLCKIPACFCMTIIIFTAPSPRQVTAPCFLSGEANATMTSSTIANISESYRNQQRHGNYRHHSTQLTAVMHPTLIEPNDKQFDIDYCDARLDLRAHAAARHIDLPVPDSSFVDLIENVDGDNFTIPCDALTHRPFYDLKETTFDVLCSRNLVAAFTQFFHLFGVVSGGLIALMLMTLYEQ